MDLEQGEKINFESVFDGFNECRYMNWFEVSSFLVKRNCEGSISQGSGNWRTLRGGGVYQGLISKGVFKLFVTKSVLWTLVCYCFIWVVKGVHFIV